jgi:phosphoglycolate phosphatase-like HAD superfamily hydrolase
LIEAVIFDFDGTLIHLPLDYDRLFQEIRRILETDNVRPLLKVLAMTNATERKRVFKIWDSIELETLPHVTLIDEGMKLYREHARKPRALVTMQGIPFVQAALLKFELSFNATATREDGLDRVKQLELVRQKLGVQFGSILFVGNKDYDQATANEVRCQFRKVVE